MSQQLLKLLKIFLGVLLAAITKVDLVDPPTLAHLQTKKKGRGLKV